MLVLAAALLMSSQAASLESGGYTERVACTASLSAAVELGPRRERERNQQALARLTTVLDQIDAANGEDPSGRQQTADAIRNAQVNVGVWQNNVQRCRALADRSSHGG